MKKRINVLFMEGHGNRAVILRKGLSVNKPGTDFLEKTKY